LCTYVLRIYSEYFCVLGDSRVTWQFFSSLRSLWSTTTRLISLNLHSNIPFSIAYSFLVTSSIIKMSIGHSHI
jgi:hypothetical protein